MEKWAIETAKKQKLRLTERTVMIRRSLQITSLVIAVCSAIVMGCEEREGREWRGLSPQVRETLRTTYPGLFIRKVEVEYKEDVKLFEVKLTHDNKEMEVRLTSQGVIVEIVTEISPTDIPPFVRKSVSEMLDTESLEDIKKVKIFATPRNGEIIPLDQPKIVYEIKYRIPEIQPVNEDSGP